MFHLDCHRDFHDMNCALVHASATPIIGVVPACLAALVSLVRLVVASIFCILSVISLVFLFACKSSVPRDFAGLQDFQKYSRSEAHIGGVLFVRSFLSIVTLGMYGFIFEKTNNNGISRCYGGVVSLNHIAGQYSTYKC